MDEHGLFTDYELNCVNLLFPTAILNYHRVPINSHGSCKNAALANDEDSEMGHSFCGAISCRSNTFIIRFPWQKIDNVWEFWRSPIFWLGFEDASTLQINIKSKKVVCSWSWTRGLRCSPNTPLLSVWTFLNTHHLNFSNQKPNDKFNLHLDSTMWQSSSTSSVAQSRCFGTGHHLPHLLPNLLHLFCYTRLLDCLTLLCPSSFARFSLVAVTMFMMLAQCHKTVRMLDCPATLVASPLSNTPSYHISCCSYL